MDNINFNELPHNSLELALAIAQDGHAGQVDKSGIDYMDHINGVVDSCYSETEKIVAALHDLVEDTGYTLQDIANYFNKEIVEAVDAITHRKGESRLDYLKRVKANKIALAVKKSDVFNNVNRLPGLKGTPDYDRLAHKYLETMIVIFEED